MGHAAPGAVAPTFSPSSSPSTLVPGVTAQSELSPSSCLPKGDRPDLTGSPRSAPGPPLTERASPRIGTAQSRGAVVGEESLGAAGPLESSSLFLAPALGVGFWGLETCNPRTLLPNAPDSPRQQCV